MFDILGDVSWPIAVVVAAVALSIAGYNINQTNKESEVRKACISQHGTVTEHATGFPTCSFR